MTDKPVLFYLHEHYEHNPQLNTSRFKDLIERCDVAFLELVSDDQTWINEAEENWNQCIKRGDLTEHKKEAGFQFITVVRSLVGTEKGIVLERSLPPSYDFFKTMDKSINALLSNNVKEAYDIQKKCLTDIVDYQNKREDNVSEQISKIKGTALVLFGAGHTRLPKLVQNKRPVEVYHPYENYPKRFFLEMYELFRDENKAFNEELSLRAIAEDFIIGAIRSHYKRWSRHEETVLAHHYAQSLTQNQILSLRDHYLFECEKIEENLKEQGEWWRWKGEIITPPYFKVFKRFCSKENVPPPDLLPKEILIGAN